jgi:hypothetical protein
MILRAFGLLYQPQMMDDDECGAVGGIIGEGNGRTQKKLPQFHFVRHKSHMTCPGLKPRPLQWKASD